MVEISASTARDILEDPVKFENELKSWVEAVKKRMSPKGKLGLPKLLDQRRLEYGLVDSLFRFQGVYDRIYVWQIDDNDMENFGEGSRLVRSDITKKRDREQSPRGIIVTAGLRALDILHSNGMALGHIVRFQYLAPYRLPVEIIDGKGIHLVVLNVGDITASEDLRELTLDGTIELQVSDGQHRYFNKKTGELWDPKLPWTQADY